MPKLLSLAMIAHLGERYTEDLKVPSSIPGRERKCKLEYLLVLPFTPYLRKLTRLAVK